MRSYRVRDTKAHNCEDPGYNYPQSHRMNQSRGRASEPSRQTNERTNTGGIGQTNNSLQRE
jgi:hypothetical protein